MITDATLTQNLDSKARNLEIRKNVLTKFLWEQKQAAEATSPPAKAPVGGTGIPPPPPTPPPQRCDGPPE